MKPDLLLLCAGLVLIALPATADPDAYLGTTVRSIERAEIIDPNPHYRGDPLPGSDGVKAVRTMTRYRLDREKVVIIPSTDPQTGRPGVPANGTGELLNGSQVLAGDNASGSGSTGQAQLGESSNAASSSNSRATLGGPSSH